VLTATKNAIKLINVEYRTACDMTQMIKTFGNYYKLMKLNNEIS